MESGLILDFVGFSLRIGLPKKISLLFVDILYRFIPGDGGKPEIGGGCLA